MKVKSILLASVAFMATFTVANAQGKAAGQPVLGMAPRYCNPLPIEMGVGGTASGDISVTEHNGKYYMYCTGGGAWVSDDLYSWKFHHVEGVPVAPDVTKYNGKFYMTGNGINVHVADDPLGPFTDLGPWKDTPSIADGWNGPFDTHIFIDDDNQPYLFVPGKAISGIFVVKLDPNDLTRFVGPMKHVIEFKPSHTWEHQGEANEYTDVAWIEGPWVYKLNGKYYLQYSASGTQWKTYAEGYYVADSPMGPYEYAYNNPLLRNVQGVVTGTAHGSMITGPDGGIWQFYTIVMSAGGRRVGMDRVLVDKEGFLTCKVTDTPQWAPGVVADPTKGDSGSIPVSIGKMRGMGANGSSVSSQKYGREASYAIDNWNGTWWEPENTDEAPSITVELSSQGDRNLDRLQLFTIDGVRLMFGGPSAPRPAMPAQATNNRRNAATAPATRNAAAAAPARRPSGGGIIGFGAAISIYKYKIEVSNDGENFQMALDMTANEGSRNTIYEDIKPVECRFVRLTVLDWPKTAPLGLIEFTVFGKATGAIPAKVAIPDKIKN